MYELCSMGIISILMYSVYTPLWEYYVYTHIVSFKWSLSDEIIRGGYYMLI